MQIKTPDLGVDSADVSEILVKVGDKIEKEQSLLVLESAKASVEVPSPASGVIKSIAIKKGQSVAQGDVLFELDEATASDAQQEEAQAPSQPASPAPDSPKNSPAAESSVEKPQPATEKKQPEPSAQASVAKTVTVPDLGVDEADVSEILVKVGDMLEKEQSICVLESSKASVEVPSPFAGMVKEIKIKTGQKVQQGAALLVIETQQTTAAKSEQPATAKADTESNQPIQHAENTTVQPQQIESGEQTAETIKPLSSAEQEANQQVYAGPAVRQLARQLGVVLANVKATGPHERILKEDVFAFVKSQLSQPTKTAAVAVASGLPPLPSFDKWGGTTIEAMSRLQQVSVPQLSLNNFIPQVTQFDLADITELENWRNSLKADYKKQDISLTILAFIAKALAYLLKQEPRFNSHLADDGKSVVLRNEIHIGIAVATEDGLTVPVLRNPDQLSIKEIAIQLGELSQKARNKKLTPNDLQGASFTITSLGSIGGTAFTPLVNWPQVAILGISPATIQPVWDGKAFQPRLMLPTSLSYDHRVINGADAARFSHRLMLLLADIRSILL
jgi:pyruvate dehydrogenase E2 component (dihydrolipoamide acetyltransferase)